MSNLDTHAHINESNLSDDSDVDVTTSNYEAATKDNNNWIWLTNGNLCVKYDAKKKKNVSFFFDKALLLTPVARNNVN